MFIVLFESLPLSTSNVSDLNCIIEVHYCAMSLIRCIVEECLFYQISVSDILFTNKKRSLSSLFVASK